MDTSYGELPARGAQMREQILGSAGVDGHTDDLHHAFREVSNALAWGGIWSRDGLGPRDRCLLTVAVLAALGITDPLPMHVRGALRNGVTPTELREALLHVGLYAGFPRAAVGIEYAAPVLEET